MKRISANGIKLIKSFEGCRLKAYKAVETEKYFTIGWGHYGADVKEGMTITQEQADDMFLEDIQRYVNSVNALSLIFSQNEFDALTSFCYNCGAGSLQKLCLGRTKEQIAEHLLKYNTSGGKVLTGLTNRRKKEQTLFLTRMLSVEDANTIVGYLATKWGESNDTNEKNMIHNLANAARVDSGQQPK